MTRERDPESQRRRQARRRAGGGGAGDGCRLAWAGRERRELRSARGGSPGRLGGAVDVGDGARDVAGGGRRRDVDGRGRGVHKAAGRGRDSGRLDAKLGPQSVAERDRDGAADGLRGRGRRTKKRGGKSATFEGKRRIDGQGRRLRARPASARPRAPALRATAGGGAPGRSAAPRADAADAAVKPVRT